MKKLQWEVTLAGADNGYLVRVGCKLLVFENKQTLINELTSYINGEKTALAEELAKNECISESAGACMPSLTDSVARKW